MLRDFKDHKAQFLSIFLMALIGVFAFTGISGEVVGMVDVSNSYYENTNLADGWIYGEEISDDVFSDIKSMEEIKDAQREMVVDTVANYSSDPEITLHVVEEIKTYPNSTFSRGKTLTLMMRKEFGLTKGLQMAVNWILEIRSP